MNKVRMWGLGMGLVGTVGTFFLSRPGERVIEKIKNFVNPPKWSEDDEKEFKRLVKERDKLKEDLKKVEEELESTVQIMRNSR